MSITVYYNPWVPDDPVRRSEILTCYRALRSDPCISRLVVLCENEHTPLLADSKPWPVESLQWPVGARPTFENYFAAIKACSRADDVNVVINSDCFIDPSTTQKLQRIKPGQAYCINRHELAQAAPPRIDRQKTAMSRRRHRYDMQDCWVIRGVPRDGMWLDFPAGRPGCDNRLAYELQKVGYAILDPYLTIRVLHHHLSDRSLIQRGDRIPRPYAYPHKFGSREAVHEWLWWGRVSAPKLAKRWLSERFGPATDAPRSRAKREREAVTIHPQPQQNSSPAPGAPSSG
jgi:hypothetical protein